MGYEHDRTAKFNAHHKLLTFVMGVWVESRVEYHFPLAVVAMCNFDGGTLEVDFRHNRRIGDSTGGKRIVTILNNLHLSPIHQMHLFDSR